MVSASVKGRGHTCSLSQDTDLVLAGNKYVSSRHCTMQLDEEGVVWPTGYKARPHSSSNQHITHSLSSLQY